MWALLHCHSPTRWASIMARGERLTDKPRRALAIHRAVHNRSAGCARRRGVRERVAAVRAYRAQITRRRHSQVESESFRRTAGHVVWQSCRGACPCCPEPTAPRWTRRVAMALDVFVVTLPDGAMLPALVQTQIGAHLIWAHNKTRYVYQHNPKRGWGIK